MAVTLETLIEQLIESRMIESGVLARFIPPSVTPKDGEALLSELCHRNLLTSFQAQYISQGRIKALQLANYTILNKIGAGGMGLVYKAQHRQMQRIVAIKTLPDSLLQDETAVSRFQREVVAAARLSHANIVAAYDAGYANDVHFLVMEYVEGIDLSAFVKKSGPVSTSQAVNYILQTARGLEYAHQKGVIHRDIKPANLLLDRAGTVKILDMGLARLNGDSNAVTQAELTLTGAVMGTIDYMAPEQGANSKDAQATADVYSLGCTLYYLLTGKAMYSGDTVIQRLLAHREQPIPAIQLPDGSVPGPLEVLYRQMVAKQVVDRFQTMTEVIAALEQCQATGTLSINSSTNKSAPQSTSGRSETMQDFLTQAPPSHQVPTDRLSAIRTRSLTGRNIAAGFLGVAILVGALAWGTQFFGIFHDPNRSIDAHEAKVAASSKPGPSGKMPDADIGAKTLPSTIRPPELPKSGDMKDPPVSRSTGLMFERPEFQQWLDDVAKLSATQQAEAVIQKLRDLNPDFHGEGPEGPGKSSKAVYEIVDNEVQELKFIATHVTDISPVRALTGLKLLFCSGGLNGPHAKLADLSPLAGMRLQKLISRNNEVSDLSPLKGMPLTHLSISETPIDDLMPLAGMALQELNCGNTRISDLSPLQGMPLTKLTFYGTKVSNLSPLANMPLAELWCGDAPVSNLSPLKGMRLRIAKFNRTQISDLTALRGMPLTELTCERTLVTDLTPLTGMSLTDFYFSPKDITTGMDVIRNMKSLRWISTVDANGASTFAPGDFWKKVDTGEIEVVPGSKSPAAQ